MMLARIACIVLALETAAVAAPEMAAPSCPAVKPLGDPASLSLKLVQGVFAATPGSVFPAISSDGSKMAMLFEDGEDFSGAPVHTLVIWNRAGRRIVSIETREPFRGPEDPPAAAPSKALRARLDRANAALAGTWRPIGAPVPCDDGWVKIDNDVRFRLDRDTGELVDARGPIARFGSIGTSNGADGEPMHGCGAANGIRMTFGSKSFGIAVVVPTGISGGDGCSHDIGVKNAIEVKIR